VLWGKSPALRQRSVAAEPLQCQIEAASLRIIVGGKRRRSRSWMWLAMVFQLGGPRSSSALPRAAPMAGAVLHLDILLVVSILGINRYRRSTG
jgi:hypothetical protein